MPKGPNQKLKLLYLMQIMLRETDDSHRLTRDQITSLLSAVDITVERKTFYNDMEQLKSFGLDIVDEQVEGHHVYYVASRDFELPELKLLVDSVQASRFITTRKSNELIKKLENLISRHEAQELQRQVLISGRIKNMNETIYYDVDKLHAAISENHQIRFRYFQWNLKKEPELRHEGRVYTVSPWGLAWDNENYYLLGYDPDQKKIKHYRVDKMRQLSVTNIPREGRKVYQEYGAAFHPQQLFGMFGGESLMVSLLCRNEIVGVLIDRFGRDIPILPVDDTHFSTHVEIVPSPQFLGWVMGLGGDIKVTSPASVVEQLQAQLKAISDQYQ